MPVSFFRTIALGLFAIILPAMVAADEPLAVAVEQVIKSTKSWDNSLLPAYPKGQPEVTLLKITVQPGVELPWHTHPIINVGYMLKGTLTVITQSGQVKTLQAGDALSEVIGTVHRGINKGDEPVEVLVFYAGIQGKSITDLRQ